MSREVFVSFVPPTFLTELYFWLITVVYHFVDYISNYCYFGQRPKTVNEKSFSFVYFTLDAVYKFLGVYIFSLAFYCFGSKLAFYMPQNVHKIGFQRHQKTLHPTPNIREHFPQVLKWVINLSCLILRMGKEALTHSQPFSVLFSFFIGFRSIIYLF